MQRLRRSLSAEFRKLTATNMWWIMAIVIFVYSAFVGGTFGALVGTMADTMPEGMGMDEVAGASMVYATAANLGYAVPVLFGAIMATGEIRHRTIGLAFLAEPRRGIVLSGKLIALLIVGFFLGLIGVVGSVGAGASVLAGLGSSPALDSGEVWGVILRAVFVLALWAVIGFGVGLLVRNQAITIVIILIFTQFIEPTVRLGAMFWEWTAEVAKFLPGSASDAFVGASYLTNLGALDPSVSGTSDASLSVWAGLAVIVVYGVLAVGLGYLTRWRGDVD